MSIIHQALKKVQDKLNPPQAQEPHEDTTPVKTIQKSYTRLFIIFGAFILVIGCLTFYYQHIIGFVLKKENKAPAVVQHIASAVKTALPQPAKEIPSKNNPPSVAIEPAQTATQEIDLQLQGIMVQDQSPVALINNTIVQVGDKVAGMQVISINENNVVVGLDGKQEILKLSR